MHFAIVDKHRKMHVIDIIFPVTKQITNTKQVLIGFLPRRSGNLINTSCREKTRRP